MKQDTIDKRRIKLDEYIKAVLDSEIALPKDILREYIDPLGYMEDLPAWNVSTKKDSNVSPTKTAPPNPTIEPEVIEKAKPEEYTLQAQKWTIPENLREALFKACKGTYIPLSRKKDTK
jgi:hypothetical protein